MPRDRDQVARDLQRLGCAGVKDAYVAALADRLDAGEVPIYASFGWSEQEETILTVLSDQHLIQVFTMHLPEHTRRRVTLPPSELSTDRLYVAEIARRAAREGSLEEMIWHDFDPLALIGALQALLTDGETE